MPIYALGSVGPQVHPDACIHSDPIVSVTSRSRRSPVVGLVLLFARLTGRS